MLIVGSGDVGRRAARLLQAAGAPGRLLALSRSAQHLPALRAAGLTPLLGDLDRPATLTRLAGLASHVLHLAPPPQQHVSGRHDPRTDALVAALRRSRSVQSLVYVSTTGVYGDCDGQWVRESQPLRPATVRAWRRVAAERRLREWGRSGVRVSILRAPGIYAADRQGGAGRERLLRASPVLCKQEDVYTNHIHADDLARACVLALWRGRSQRVYHASDASELKMGDYFDLAADIYGLPRPQRVSRAQAQALLTPLQLSFMSESRRLDNHRLLHQLRLRLRYPTVREGLLAS